MCTPIHLLAAVLAFCFVACGGSQSQPVSEAMATVTKVDFSTAKLATEADFVAASPQLRRSLRAKAGLPTQPEQSIVYSEIERVRNLATQCEPPAGASMTVTVVFSGQHGLVENIKIDAGLEADYNKECIEKAVRSMHVQAFRDAQFTTAFSL